MSLGNRPTSSANRQKIMRLRKRAMRRFFFCATCTSLRVRALLNSTASRSCSEERAISAILRGEFLGDLSQGGL